MDDLITLIEQWSTDRGLDKAESRTQLLKTVEEVGELATSLLRDDRDGIIDGLGDVFVTLVILAQQQDLSLYDCVIAAYSEIKDRKGQTVNNVFIKEELK